MQKSLEENLEEEKSYRLSQLAYEIADALDDVSTNDAINLCGSACLRIIQDRPDNVIKLAHGKIHAVQYQHVGVQWCRLFEEASLHKAVQMLHAHVDADDMCVDDTWLTEIVTVLDRAILLTGTPGRKQLFETFFEQLDELFPYIADAGVPGSFNMPQPPSLDSNYIIRRSSGSMDLETFQELMHKQRQPLIIPDMLEAWPARQLWSNPRYLLSRTLGGRRLVPVEVGRTYTDEDWSQRTMSMREYLTTYLLPNKPEEIGYLAQHDLFEQIPALKADIVVPDVCYTDPPSADGATLRTAGLSNANQLDEPQVNAWLGPMGTTTPLHTDPYHNILCQVVGYKYVRLYAPDQTPNIYPRGVDGNGINMENTSQVDVSRFRDCIVVDREAGEEMRAMYPKFEEAKYVEGILKPGECLYIPLGWWHYVESLSTSFSVSFWWN